MDVTQMILMTDAEYAPVLILMGLLVPFIYSFGRCLLGKSEAAKTKDVGSYEGGILGGNALVAVIGVLATLCIPGLYYDAVGAEQVASGMYLIGLAVSIFWAVFGDLVVFRFIEYRRNQAKIAASQTSTATEGTGSETSQTKTE